MKQNWFIRFRRAMSSAALASLATGSCSTTSSDIDQLMNGIWTKLEMADCTKIWRADL